ncbi:dual specificity protein phosphatase family protein [bacterium]|nr:dual specificity protein phosphatase family protein [bacterium]
MVYSLTEHNNTVASPILRQIHFSLLSPYSIAGMGEPWLDKMAATHAALKASGIGAILTLTEDNMYGNLHVQAGFSVQHEPIDDAEPPTNLAMDRALVFINQAQERQLGVAVHCLEGRGRTGTVLCAWLACKEQLACEQAISRLRKLRPYTALSTSQQAFLHLYLKSRL